MRTQISHIEAMERREAEFMVEKAKEKEFVTKEIQARMQLERELAEKKQKNLKLEYEAKTRRLERELKEKKFPTIKESESGDKEIARTVQQRLRGTLETYTSKIARPVHGRGIFDKPAPGIHGPPRVLNPVLPEMLPPVPTFTPGMTGPKPTVICGNGTRNRWCNFVAFGKLSHTDISFERQTSTAYPRFSDCYAHSTVSTRKPSSTTKIRLGYPGFVCDEC